MINNGLLIRIVEVRISETHNYLGQSRTFLIKNNLLRSLILCHLYLKFHLLQDRYLSPFLFVTSVSKCLTKIKYLFLPMI